MSNPPPLPSNGGSSRASPNLSETSQSYNDQQLQQQQRYRQQHASLYRYAMDEFACTLPPGASNDDGNRDAQSNSRTTPVINTAASATVPPPVVGLVQSASSFGSESATSSVYGDPRSTTRRSRQQSKQYDSSSAAAGGGGSTMDDNDSRSGHSSRGGGGGYVNMGGRPSPSQQQHNNNNNNIGIDSGTTTASVFHPATAVADTMYYEEVYGQAYTGGNLKYLYPSGYQSMRPRSCPWKLSIVIFLVFTWLSIFIVGHCSDRSIEMTNNANNNNNAYNNANAQENANSQENYYAAAGDDDTATTAPVLDDIDIRWCGSRPLYLLWATSMLITGLSAAYCSVIGYIHIRDFSVANSRSSQGGLHGTASDYYVQLGGATGSQQQHPYYYNNTHRPGSPGSDSTSSVNGGGMYGGAVQRRSIYQSDGTPQFWGAHIYRPTQAAVAVTTR